MTQPNSAEHVESALAGLRAGRQHLTPAERAALVEWLDETCRWTQIDQGGCAYNCCESGESFHIEQGCDPWPYCHHCGRPVELVPWEEWGDE